MNDDARTKLIRLEMTEPAIRREMDAMTNYKLGFVRALTKADLEKIDNYGFRFRAKTLAGKREEIKNYIQEHPSLRGDSVASIKANFKRLGRLAEELGHPGNDSETESSSDYSSSSSSTPPKKKSRSKGMRQLKKSDKNRSDKNKTPKKSPKKKSKTLSESSSPDSSTDDSVKTSKSKANSKKSKTDSQIVPLSFSSSEEQENQQASLSESPDEGDIF